MKSIKIIQAPNKILNTNCAKVEHLNKDVKDVISKLQNALNNSKVPGTGIAANQIGINMKVCIVRDFYSNESQNEDEYNDYILINPTYKKLSNKQTLDWEGCLSIPDTFGLVKRYKKIKVEALNENGQKISITAKDYLARVMQHEIDHLEGILFTSKVLGDTKTEKELDKIYN